MQPRSRRHTTHKLVRSDHEPAESRWHIASWDPVQDRWQNIVVNVSVDEAWEMLRELGAITQTRA